jgi:hypothetical protein
MNSAAFSERSGPTPTRMTVQPQLADSLHEVAQAWHVKAVLGLDEIGPGFDFLGQAQRPPFERRCERVGRRPKEQPRWDSQLAAAEKRSLVPHDLDRPQQVDGIKVENPLGLRLVADRHIVAGQAQNIAHAHRRGPKHVALNGDAVPVAARNLQHRRVAGPGQQSADGHAGHVTVRARGVGSINGVTDAGENERGIVHLLGIGAVRGVQLGRHRKPAGAQHAF